jgi:Tfp pilus assembly protein PilZ
MAHSVDQIEKHTIVARLSVSIYKMDDSQLLQLLQCLENQPAPAGGIPSSALPDRGPGMRRQMLIARIFIVINQLDKDELLQRLRPFKNPSFRWVREYPRLACYIMVDFASGDKAYRSCIRDISASGVFIETTDKFKVGQAIALCFTISESDEMLPFKTKGKVTRLYPDGIGVQYEHISRYQRDILDALVHQAPR